jgi:hypothetical protein
MEELRGKLRRELSALEGALSQLRQ